MRCLNVVTDVFQLQLLIVSTCCISLPKSRLVLFVIWLDSSSRLASVWFCLLMYGISRWWVPYLPFHVGLWFVITTVKATLSVFISLCCNNWSRWTKIADYSHRTCIYMVWHMFSEYGGNEFHLEYHAFKSLNVLNILDSTYYKSQIQACLRTMISRAGALG